MAAWQAQFYLVPPTRLQSGFRARLEQVLPRNTLDPTHPFERWGSPARDCIEILQDHPAFISARFDMRAPAPDLWKRFLAIVQEESLQLQNEWRRPVAPKLGAFVRALSESTALRYVRDPEIVLRSVSASELEDV